MGRPGQPNEVAPSFLFLACEDSSYMSGQVLHPNGGSSDPFQLQRFVDAQQRHYVETALTELLAGRKQSHWMWFIFPQHRRPRPKPYRTIYAIRSLSEARAFLPIPTLAERYRESVEAILSWADARPPQKSSAT
jgi:uncharacterized protein (DUF1810 family)